MKMKEQKTNKNINYQNKRNETMGKTENHTRETNIK